MTTSIPSGLHRRAVLAAAGLLASAARANPPPNGRLLFAVFRNGAHVGEHNVAFSRADGGLKATSAVAMTLRLGPVPIYRYEHHAVEQWRDERFERLETTTLSNGKAERVTATHGDQGLRIETAAGVIQAPDAAVPLTHWNAEAMRPPLFNPQTGKMLRVSCVHHSGDRLPAPLSGAATRLTVTGDAQIEDWYDDDGVWAALRGRLPDHSILEYRRT
jgi:Family of unknown function (DUF6134)